MTDLWGGRKLTKTVGAYVGGGGPGPPPRKSEGVWGSWRYHQEVPENGFGVIPHLKENSPTEFTIKGKGSGRVEPLAEQLLSNATGSVLSITSVTVKLSDKCGGSTWPTVSFSSESCVGN